MRMKLKCMSPGYAVMRALVITGCGGGSGGGEPDGGNNGDGQTIDVTGITLTKTTTEILLNETETLIAEIQPSDATNKNIIWSTTDPSIVSVDQSGLIKGVSAGSATIAARSEDGNHEGICDVTVKDTGPVHVTGITLTKTTTEILVNGTETLVAEIQPLNATNTKVIWSSADPAIVMVDQSGQITGVSVGTADVFARSEDGNHEAECAVTVKNNAPAPQYHLKKRLNYGNNLRTVLSTNDPLIQWYAVRIETQVTATLVCYDDVNYSIGPDGIAFTEDDSITGYYRGYLENGVFTGGKFFNTIGKDGIWFTNDEQAMEFQKNEFDSSHRVIREIRYNHGLDLKFETSDDSILRIKRIDYDSNGKVSLEIIYDNPGSDGDWYTYSDNTIRQAGANGSSFPKFFSNNNYVKYQTGVNTWQFEIWNAGPDRIPLTGDDFCDLVEIETFQNNILDTINIYTGPGADAVWFTEDDDKYERITNNTTASFRFMANALQTYSTELWSGVSWGPSTRIEYLAYDEGGNMIFYELGWEDPSDPGTYKMDTSSFNGWEVGNWYYVYEKY